MQKSSIRCGKKGKKSKSFPSFQKILFIFILCPSICLFYIWLFFHCFSTNLPNEKEPLLFYSNQCRQDLRIIFLEAIQRSKKSIYLAMYGITEPSIIKSLLLQKTQKKVSMRIYYDPKGSKNLRKLIGENAFPIPGKGLMHQKILVTDEELVFLGSANLTKSSLSRHQNLVIGLKNVSLAKFLKKQTPLHSGRYKTKIKKNLLDLWLLPDYQNTALFELRKTLASAKKNIKIAMFTFTHPLLVQELIQAHEKGIQVTVVLDFHSSIGASKYTVETLQKAGIEVLMNTGLELLHHKFAWIDENTLVVGSANWTRGAFVKNYDYFLILKNLNNSQNKFLKRLWKTIFLEASSLKS